MALNKTMRSGAGTRATFVVIEKARDAQPNNSYEVLPEWPVLCERWAREMMTSGREFQAAMQTVAMLQGILKLPYDEKTALISSRDRAKIGNRILNFAAPPINEGGMNETITLWCIEPEQ